MNSMNSGMNSMNSYPNNSFMGTDVTNLQWNNIAGLCTVITGSPGDMWCVNSQQQIYRDQNGSMRIMKKNFTFYFFIIFT
jgi:hypothetical protein